MRLHPNSTVTAILARCLLEPQFQQWLSRNPSEVLQNYKLSGDIRSSFAQFEFEKLDLFGGLITQTQHNFLWETFPESRALMKRYGIEVSLFSSYRKRTTARAEEGLSKEEKTERLTDYLKDFLLTAPDRRSCPGLLEVLTHERIRWDLEKTTGQEATTLHAPREQIPTSARAFDRLVPTFPLNVRFAEYRYDPLEIASALYRREFDPARLRRRPTRLCYQMDAVGGQLSVFQTTPTVALLFRKVGNGRTVGSILRTSTSKRPKQELRRYFESAHEGGLIEFRSSQ